MVTALVSLLIVSACEHNFYKTGDSELSYLHTDFVEAHTNELSAFASATTDDGVQLTLKPAVKELWATKSDTTYRALLYYNKVENGVTSSFAISPVAVLRPRLALDFPTVYTDPIGFESIWMSKNRKYLNLALTLKTGKTEDKKAIQSLAIVCDSIKHLSSGERAFYLRLHHHQNGVPEYYSRRIFTSIPLIGFKQNDVIYLNINTYKGKVNKQITL
nr:NigD-like C-terminal domain-containing protein [uncultured Prevotella sp.]